MIAEPARSRPGMVSRSSAGREADRHHLQGAHGQRARTRRSRRSRRTSRSRSGPGWGKDYADALDLLRRCSTAATIIPTGNTNYSLVGLTPAQSRTQGDRRLQAVQREDRDGRPERQRAARQVRRLIGPARADVLRELDKYLMTKVVPWVPYLWPNVNRITSPNVTQCHFDQFGDQPAYAHVAVKYASTHGRPGAPARTRGAAR